MYFKINQIVSLYEYLGTDIHDDLFDDVEKKIIHLMKNKKIVILFKRLIIKYYSLLFLYFK